MPSPDHLRDTPGSCTALGTIWLGEVGALSSLPGPFQMWPVAASVTRVPVAGAQHTPLLDWRGGGSGLRGQGSYARGSPTRLQPWPRRPGTFSQPHPSQPVQLRKGTRPSAARRDGKPAFQPAGHPQWEWRLRQANPPSPSPGMSPWAGNPDPASDTAPGLGPGGRAARVAHTPWGGRGGGGLPRSPVALEGGG